MKRRIAVSLALIGLFFLVVTARVVYSSRKEYLRGHQAMEAGRTDIAIVHYRRSAHWYAPGNPYSSSALDALWKIGDQAEGAGRINLALAAYRAIRSSILGTRSFYTPHKDILAKVNPRIAALMARQELELRARDERLRRAAAQKDQDRRTKKAPRAQEPTRPSATKAPAASAPSTATATARATAPATPTGTAGKGRSPTAPGNQAAPSPEDQASTGRPLDPTALERLKTKHLKLLNKTNMPSVGWSLLAILGLALWVGSAFAFAYRAVTFDDHLDGKKAIFWGSLILVGLAVWVLGLAFA